MLRCFILCFVC